MIPDDKIRDSQLRGEKEKEKEKEKERARKTKLFWDNDCHWSSSRAISELISPAGGNGT
jgi:hypothetical protein